mmetsp:Transcript_59297/g.130179  ORF Transcript_59297/g.130179 Transcript_59297/m.130179 type:complete len:80 (-) Transcript_59297:1143-1382(-)
MACHPLVWIPKKALASSSLLDLFVLHQRQAAVGLHAALALGQDADVETSGPFEEPRDPQRYDPRWQVKGEEERIAWPVW